MSRAIEPGSIEPLQTEALQSIYNDHVAALTLPETGELLDIEFLGKSHLLPQGCNVLKAESSVGISKPRLIQAFVVARQVFLRFKSSSLLDRSLDLRNATAIMLLMDPEHLTAANTRKRLLQVTPTRSSPSYEHALRSELGLVDSYLTSRLHRHTKSPTLWSHRRWLMEQFQVVGIKPDIDRDLKAVVLVAAERHPRNYYAWSHLRWLVQRPVVWLQDPQPPILECDLLVEVVEVVKDWCLKHPSDISGFSFLLFCLFNGAEMPSKDRSSIVCQEVLHLTNSFHWSHDSVWTFLRTLIASGLVGQDLIDEFVHTSELLQETRPDMASTLIASRQWVDKYRQEI